MRKPSLPLLCAAFIGALLALALFLFGLARYDSLSLLWPLDAGVLTQVAYNTAHGDLFHHTIRFNASYTSLHRSPVVLLLAPALWIWPDARSIMVVEAALLGLSALLVFGIARRSGSSDRLALFLTAGYALSTPLWAVGLDDLWFDKLVVPAILLTLWALEADRKILPLIGTALILSVQEGYVVAAGVVAAVCLLRRDRSWPARLGPLLIVAAYVTAFDLIFTSPEMGPGAIRAIIGRVGGGPAEAEVHWEWYFAKLIVFALGFGPTLLLVWGAPRWIWMLAPGAAKMLLIGPLLYHHKSIYYVSDLLPLAFYVAAKGLPRWRGWIGRLAADRADLVRSVSIAALAWWAIPTAILMLTYPAGTFRPTDEDRGIRAMAASIPSDRVVHVDMDFAPLVACRPWATLEAEPDQRPLALSADDLLLWSVYRTGHIDPMLTVLRTAALIMSPRFEVAARVDGAVHLRVMEKEPWIGVKIGASVPLENSQEDRDDRPAGIP